MIAQVEEHHFLQSLQATLQPGHFEDGLEAKARRTIPFLILQSVIVCVQMENIISEDNQPGKSNTLGWNFSSAADSVANENKGKKNTRVKWKSNEKPFVYLQMTHKGHTPSSTCRQIHRLSCRLWHLTFGSATIACTNRSSSFRGGALMTL